MRLVVIGDTHGRHEELGILEGDVLIHCGDFCDDEAGGGPDVDRVDAWFARQRVELVLCVGGNHDFGVAHRVETDRQVFRNAVWLLDRPYTHRGVQFFGSPWVPHLEGWAFYLSEEGLKQKWSLIPEDTDVLITHTPPYGVLDQPRGSESHLGCPQLLDRVNVVRPRYHVFGHIHAGAGTEEREHTTFVNASVFSRGSLTRPATMLDLPVARH